MGYILPITQHEFKDYQRRVTKDTQDLHYIEKPYKIFLDMQQKSDYNRKLQHEFKLSKKQYMPAIVPEQITTDPVYAKITGKGSLFNQSV